MNTSKKTTGAASVSNRTGARLLRSIQIIALMLLLAVMDAPSLGAQVGRGSAPYLHNDRVVSLIVHLADQAQLSRDVQFAVRAQAQAGLLVWPYDRQQARAIFRKAFQQLLLPSAFNSQPASAPEIATLQQLRTELLNQIACRDSEMADILAREFALSKQLPVDKQAVFVA